MFFKNNIFNLLAILLVIVVSLPILISICYVVPGADDFCNAYSAEKLREGYSFLLAAVIYSKNVFMQWQGTYFSSFIIGLHPNIHNSYFALKAILFCCFVIFVSGLFLTILIFAKNILKLSKLSSYVVSVIISMLALNTTRGGEWFTWYTGCAVYQIPMICYLYSTFFFLLYFIKRKLYLIIISTVLSVLAAGGSLPITSLGSSILLFTLSITINKQELFSKQNLILSLPVIMSLVGGLANSLAPGNFARHSVIEKSGELHFFRSLKYSIYSFLEHTTYLNKFSVIFLLLIVFIIIYKKEILEISQKQFLLLVLYSLISIVLVAFPILLGYSSKKIDFFSRMAYSFDLSIILYIVALTVSLACYLRKNGFVESFFVTCTKIKYLPTIILILLSVVCFAWFYSGFKNGYAYKTMRELRKGYIQEATSSLLYAYTELSKSKNVDVVLSIKPYRSSTIFLPGISESPTHWINYCSSRYLGAKSCSIKFNLFK